MKAMPAKKSKPWKVIRPEGPATQLTPAAKATAMARAKKARRKYPNLVDNMYAAVKQKAGQPARKK